MREARDARLDEAIDRAVREMLDVEPPAGLRGRVLDRLERPRRTFAWTWIALPVAAAAILILAVLAPWRQATQPAPTAPVLAKVEPQIVAPNVEAPVPMVPSKGVSTPPGQASVSTRQPAQRPAVDRMIVATVAAADDTTSQIDPLGAIAPITVAGTHPEAIAPKQIAISPLTPITELQIAPLSPPDRRN